MRVTVLADRIEISSPGQVLPGIDFAHPSGPKWRNAGLSAFLRKLQLAQAEGQGVPKIIGERPTSSTKMMR